MKILYCVQLTGNGHITRANELIRIFKKRAHVDVLVSGTQSSLKLKEKVKFRYKGLSFVFGKEGGIDFIKTNKIFNPFRFIKEILNCPVDKYDLIINDFELVFEKKFSVFYKDSIVSVFCIPKTENRKR